MGIAIKDLRLIPRRALTVAAILTMLVFAQIALAIPEKTLSSRVLALKLQKGTSLNDLIRTAGYDISDEDVVLFLTEFMELNPAVKSVSALKRGTFVRLPLKHLKKTVDKPAIVREKIEISNPKLRIARQRTPVLAKPASVRIDRSILLRNIQKLFSSLGEDVSLEKEGFKYFSLSEKSDMSFDTGLFPVMDLHNDRILVIDYTGAFPEDLRNLLEVSWPEYRVVSPQGNVDLRGIVPILLQESGYLFQGSDRMVSGGATQVEYYADFLVHGKSGKPMDRDITLVSVLDSSEYQTPQEIISWLRNRDVQIIELSEQERIPAKRPPGAVLEMRRNTSGKAFVESVLTLMGLPFSRDEKINLSVTKDIQFSVIADLLIDMGYKKKIIEFSGLSDLVMKNVRKFGIDITQIEPWEGKNDMLEKIISLLSLSYTNSPKNNASSLVSGNTRHRILVPGFVVKSLKGVFFLTDANLDEELQENIISNGVSVVKF